MFFFGLVKYFKRGERQRTRGILQPEYKDKYYYSKEKGEEMGEVANVNEIPVKIRNHKYPAKEHNLRVKDLLLNRNPKLSKISTAFFIAGEELEETSIVTPTKILDRIDIFIICQVLIYLLRRYCLTVAQIS